MRSESEISLIEYFTELEDPRIDRTKHHQLLDIINIAVCGVICGAENWVDIELANGIPSHDTSAECLRN